MSFKQQSKVNFEYSFIFKWQEYGQTRQDK